MLGIFQFSWEVYNKDSKEGVLGSLEMTSKSNTRHIGMNQENRIEVKNASYRVNGKNILEDVSFSVREGDFISVIGPNGAGKSTLLKCMVRIIEPTSGSIKLAGKNISSYKLKELSKQVAFVPQNTDYNFPFSVSEIVLMGRIPHLGRLRVEGKEDYKVAEMCLKTVGMEEFSERIVTTLSGGEKQLVSIARAIAQEPKFLLLDEPTSNLDIYHQLNIMNLLRTLSDGKTGVVVVLHDLRLAAKFCDKILALSEGECVAFGNADDVLSEDIIENVFDVRVEIIRSKRTGNKVIDLIEPV